MKRSDFSFHLPAELIAQEPRPRGESRMMVIDRTQQSIGHSVFRHFPSHLGPEDVLVLNDTAVFPARLFARPKAGMTRPLEFLLTRRLASRVWTSWCKPARRIHRSDRIEFSEKLIARVVEKRQDGTITLEFEGDDEAEVWKEIDRIGVTPLPPYIRRTAGEDLRTDRQAYQTVYAAERGAIAAPTAGLHFSEAILDEIANSGVDIIRLTLHVGIGTFQPVKAMEISEHRMASERYVLSDEAASGLNRARAAGKRIVAAGTTSVRALESAAIAGGGRFEAGEGETSIFITPGYEFQVVGGLLTNFHLPESTLIMLVSSFAGVDLVREAYRQAIEGRYLFYSYGDCMFVQ